MAKTRCIPDTCCPQNVLQRVVRRRPQPVRRLLLVQSDRRLLFVFRALLGAVSGAVLFLGVSHNLPLNLDLKLTAGAAFTGVCAVSGACSSFIRCSLLLTFPMMLGSRGRAYIVLLLISVLYTGPVQNIQRNLEDAALSLSCNLDLQLNHSRLLWRRAVVPFISMAQELTESTMNFGDETVNVSRRFATFQQEVMSQHGSVSLAADANDTQQQFTKRTMMQCDGVVQEAVLRCSGWFRQKWTQCMSLIQVPVLNHLLCFPMKFSFLCDILRVMTSWCKDRIPLEGNLGQLWNQLNQSLNQFSSEFRAQLVLQEQQDQSALDGSLLDQDFTESVRDSFVGLTSVSEVLLELLQTAKSFTFITIIIQAVSYLVKYKKDVRFDNVYITSYFRRIDARRKSEGKRCVLPLTNTDRSRFIQPCSLRIHPQEAPQLFSGLVQLASVSLLVLVLVSVDLALFRVLDIVSRNTVTHFNITGGHQVDLRVGGASMMARLLQKTISAFNSSSDFDIDSSNKICECRPRPLSVSVYFSCVGCVLLVALFSLLQVYSSRIRRVLTAAYHPEREKRRVLFLYNLLLQKHTSSADRKSITRHYCDSVCFSRCCASSCRQNKDQSDSEEVHYDAG